MPNHAARSKEECGEGGEGCAPLLDEKKHPHVRLGAARTVAELGVHQHDAETILKKLGEIEAYQGRHRR